VERHRGLVVEFTSQRRTTMTDKSSDDSKALDKTSTGAHLGGTHFGQTGGDAKTKDNKSGDKARPNDGKR
jgi:hypothetical protein